MTTRSNGSCLPYFPVFGSSLCSYVPSVVKTFWLWLYYAMSFVATDFLALALIRVYSRAFAAKCFLISVHQRRSAVKKGSIFSVSPCPWWILVLRGVTQK